MAHVPKEGAELFNKALAVLYVWTIDELNDGQIEPSIMQRYSIGAACDLVQAFGDPMPANAYELLMSLPAAAHLPFLHPQTSHTQSGATCLRALRDKRLRVDWSDQPAAAKPANLTRKGCPRITSKNRIDALPQLFNVLQGEMSISDIVFFD